MDLDFFSFLENTGKKKREKIPEQDQSHDMNKKEEQHDITALNYIHTIIYICIYKHMTNHITLSVLNYLKSKPFLFKKKS